MIKRSINQDRRSFEELQFSQFDFYTIECKSNDFKLREELKSYKMEEGDKVRVIGGEHGEPASEVLSFLWMFKPREGENGLQFQIIHARTNLSLVTEDYQCSLTEDKEPQYFTIVQVGKNVFKIKDRNECFLTLDGILQTSDMSEKDSAQEFSVKSYRPEAIPQLEGTGLLLQIGKKHAIGLNYSFKQGEEEIILQQLNHRMSQRWLFVKVQSQKQDALLRSSVDRSQSSKKFKFYIRSLLTEQFVSYNRQKKKLVQSSYPQEWRIDCRSQQNGVYYIQHVKLNNFLAYNQNHKLLLSTQPCEWLIPKSIIEHALKRQQFRNSI